MAIMISTEVTGRSGQSTTELVTDPGDTGDALSPAAAEPGRRGTRDLRLDMLRGYALLAMAVDHVGLYASYFHTFSGRGIWIISAAEGFIIISGLTLGTVLSRESAQAGAARVVRRTGEVWAGAVGLILGMVLLYLLTGLQPWYAGEWVAEEGAWVWLLDVLGLQVEMSGTGILVFYVLVLAAALPAVVMLHQRRAWLVVFVVMAVWLLAQVRPEAVDLPFASFRSVAANAPLFLIALVVGFHGRALSAWWRTRRWARALDVVTVAVAAALGALHTLGYPGLPWLADRLGGEDPLSIRETTMPWATLLAVTVVFRAIWLVVTWAWPVVYATLGRPLAYLGAASLITFGSDLLAIQLFWGIPGNPGDVIDSRWLATALIAVYLALMIVPVVAIRSLQRWVRAAGPRVRRASTFLPVVLIVSFGAGVLALG